MLRFQIYGTLHVFSGDSVICTGMTMDVLTETAHVLHCWMHRYIVHVGIGQTTSGVFLSPAHWDSFLLWSQNLQVYSTTHHKNNITTSKSKYPQYNTSCIKYIQVYSSRTLYPLLFDAFFFDFYFFKWNSNRDCFKLPSNIMNSSADYILYYIRWLILFY